MIGQLRGILLEKHPPFLLIDVQGVGYDVEAPMSTFYQLPNLDAPCKLHTHLTIRDDAHLLYGFATLAERRFFRALLKVNGVGAKLALAILSSIEAPDFVRYIQDHDSQKLIRLQGVGKKTAERLIVEMGDSLNQWYEKPLNTSQQQQPTADNAVDDAISALIALGYKATEATKRVKAIQADGLSSEQLIRQALQG